MTETANTSILQDLRILAVDDEIDILETIQDLLDESDVDQATDYDSALEKMSEQNYDFAILDIMGVNGMELLEEAVGRNIPTVMLTCTRDESRNTQGVSQQRRTILSAEGGII